MAVLSIFPRYPKITGSLSSMSWLPIRPQSDGCTGEFERGAHGALSSFIAPRLFQGVSLFDQPVLQYFDAGSAPSLTAVADTTLISFSSATLSGYLLDCATTPCAAIAP